LGAFVCFAPCPLSSAHTLHAEGLMASSVLRQTRRPDQFTCLQLLNKTCYATFERTKPPVGRHFAAACGSHMHRAGQNRICTPYVTVCMVINLLKIPYIHRTYIYMYGSGQPNTCTMHTHAHAHAHIHKTHTHDSLSTYQKRPAFSFSKERARILHSATSHVTQLPHGFP